MNLKTLSSMLRVTKVRSCAVLLAVVSAFSMQVSTLYGDTQDSVSFEKLLRNMVDITSLAEFPFPPYRAGRSSSYERISPVDSVPAWFANNDHGYYLDTLPEGKLMVDVSGPGVITHIWSARSNGDLHFYFDDDSTPSWTVSMKFLLNGSGPIPPPFSYITAAQGENCYFPIPFRKRCRIFYSGTSPDIYYQIDYRIYPAGTAMPTFDTTMLQTHAGLVDSVGSILADKDRFSSLSENGADYSNTIGEHESVTVAELNGPGAITEIGLRFDTTTESAFLRQCLLEITFDDADHPQVLVPAGDFFCGIPDRPAHGSLPVGIDQEKTMICRWCMPYRSSAVVRLRNTGTTRCDFNMSIATSPYTITDNTMHFYARWRNDPEIVTSRHLYWVIQMVDSLQDHPIIHITGKGVHVGTILQIWNREDAWWGEGDDKILIDDDTSGYILGTGTEDYFGYAWSSKNTFSNAYHSQPSVKGHNGFVTNARYHISDPQPFIFSYKFDMEIQTAYRPTSIDYGRAVLFYGAGEITTDHDTLTDDDTYLRSTTGTVRRPALQRRQNRTVAVRYEGRHSIVIETGDKSSPIGMTARILRLDGKQIASYRSGAGRIVMNVAEVPAGLYIVETAAAGKTVDRIRFLIGK